MTTAATIVYVTLSNTGHGPTVSGIGDIAFAAQQANRGEHVRRWIDARPPIVGQPVRMGEHVDIY